MRSVSAQRPVNASRLLVLAVLLCGLLISQSSSAYTVLWVHSKGNRTMPALPDQRQPERLRQHELAAEMRRLRLHAEYMMRIESFGTWKLGGKNQGRRTGGTALIYR